MASARVAGHLQPGAGRLPHWGWSIRKSCAWLAGQQASWSHGSTTWRCPAKLNVLATPHGCLPMHCARTCDLCPQGLWISAQAVPRSLSRGLALSLLWLLLCFEQTPSALGRLSIGTKSTVPPWLVWHNGLRTGLGTERSPDQFPVRANAWVASQVPIWRHVRGNQSVCLTH